MKVRFVSQLDYPDIPYYTALDVGGLPEDKNTFAVSGCGICCLIMAVESLCGDRITPEEGVALSEKYRANRHPGTDLDILFKNVLPQYGLEFQTTNDVNILKEWIEDGGVAVANTGGDRDGYKCPFSPRGHYIFLFGADEDQVFVYDTVRKPGKYEDIDCPEITIAGESLIVDFDFLDRACDNKNPRYCLIKK